VSKHCRNRDFRLFYFCDRSLDLMTFIYELDQYTGCANVNFLRQGFRKLSYYRHTDRQTRPKVYTTPLREWSVKENVRHTLYIPPFTTRSSATAKSTARPSCLVGVLLTFIGRQTTDQQLINHLYETVHETYRIPRNNAK